MKKWLSALLCLTVFCPGFLWAMLSMELTRGVLGAIPVTVVPFEGGENAPQSVSAIIANDLQNSGRFKLSKRGGDHVVSGHVSALGGDRYQVSFALREDVGDQASSKVLLHHTYAVSGRELRATAHHISDAVYQAITGTRGVFSTKIAYVLIQHDDYGRKRYLLEVADQDGYSPKPLLNSPEPIMSPTWAPNGKQIAYVSFEHRQAGIYLQNVMTGERTLVSHMPGINGAPAFSPDGRKLAIVLSTTGTPNIYIMDLTSHQVTPVTHDSYINTEPAWSPSGRSLIFTSNRSGGPQIYQANLQSHAVTRLTYDGNYNARGSYTPDGKHVVMIHTVSGIFSIGMLDIDSGTLRILSSRSTDSASPSVAPNGSMVLYDMVSSGRNILGMVSSDGRIQLVMPAREGDAQDPAWSPYLA